MIRCLNTCSKTWNRATITTHTSQSTHSRGTHETRSRALTRGRHARTHARTPRENDARAFSRFYWRHAANLVSVREDERTVKGGAERGRNATNFRAARRVYHCPRIPAELWVHGNKGKCASPIGSDPTETVNPVAIYVAVISIILRSYHLRDACFHWNSSLFFDRTIIEIKIKIKKGENVFLEFEKSCKLLGLLSSFGQIWMWIIMKQVFWGLLMEESNDEQGLKF